MAKNKILITSALPYVNGIPHLGHLAGCLLPSDVFARFNRLIGNQVLYIAGTDEHGSPCEIGAKKENLSLQEYTLKYHNIHKDIYEKFSLSFDIFGRTSSSYNTKMTQKIAKQLFDNGFIYEKEDEQIFSIDDNMFLPDRYVIGTCPFCGSDNARGDQCENCTKVLDTHDLIAPKSSISGSSNLEFRKTKHLYLALSKLTDKLKAWIDTRNWNKLTLGIAYKWLDEGLQDRSITRDLKWGVPVPSDYFPDMQNKVFYVWFDAPIAYISITQELLGDDFQSWWLMDKGADKVQYFQFMGKDNVPFHAITFPATLLGADPNYKKVDTIKGLSYLNFNGGKFSKSSNRGIFANDAIVEFEPDYWRYWLIKNAPETDDTDFSFERFADDINKDLNDVFGNFILRVLKFYNSKFGNVISHDVSLGDLEINLISSLQEKIQNYTSLLQNLEFRKALAELRAIWVSGNEYIDQVAPWVIFKQNPSKAGQILTFLINLIRVFAILAQPVIPNSSKKILDALHTSGNWIFDLKNEISSLSSGHSFDVPDTIFNKILPERVAQLNQKYNT